MRLVDLVADTLDLRIVDGLDPTIVGPTVLALGISQSGETADTLAALKHAEEAGYLATLAICNVAESSIVRQARLVLMTRAGPEIGVASTKAFYAQVAAGALVSCAIAEACAADADALRAIVHAHAARAHARRHRAPRSAQRGACRSAMARSSASTTRPRPSTTISTAAPPTTWRCPNRLPAAPCGTWNSSLACSCSIGLANACT